MKARITALWRYPIKACAAQAVSQLQLDDAGWPVGDRSLAVVDALGEVTWMGAVPGLARVHATQRPDGLHLRTATGQTLVIPGDATGSPAEARAWSGARQAFDRLEVFDMGDAAAALLQAATGQPLRLIRLSEAAARRPGLQALHLCSEASLQAWREAQPRPLDHLAQRVRPNIVLGPEPDDDFPPFLEDLITSLQAGPLHLTNVEPCVRCIVPNVDPRTAEPQPDALQTLTQLSAERYPGRAVQFGIYLRADGPGQLNVGQPVELTLDFDAR